MDKEGIAKLSEKDVGLSEENVKQKILVPILELLGHKRQMLDFEYYTSKGKRIDIFIRNVPPDCKVIIDTKNYSENLNDQENIEQIRDYTFNEGALIAIIANGTEIKIYSPLRGVSFEKSLLYYLNRQDISKESVWKILSNILHNDNLQNRSVLEIINMREKEIKEAMINEELLKHEFDSKIEGIDSDIETKEDEILQLHKEKDVLEKDLSSKISNIWTGLNLPLYMIRKGPTITSSVDESEKDRHARNVTLQELVDAGLVKNGQTLYFYHGHIYKDEHASIVANDNRLKYKGDGKLHSTSDLARIIDVKLKLSEGKHGVAGPKYWKTEDGKLLHDLNEIVRRKS